MDDPMEKMIEEALKQSKLCAFPGGMNGSLLDFWVQDKGVYIEVKQFYSERVLRQMKLSDNIILAQGEKAVKWLAELITKA